MSNLYKQGSRVTFNKINIVILQLMPSVRMCVYLFLAAFAAAQRIDVNFFCIKCCFFFFFFFGYCGWWRNALWLAKVLVERSKGSIDLFNFCLIFDFWLDIDPFLFACSSFFIHQNFFHLFLYREHTVLFSLFDYRKRGDQKKGLCFNDLRHISIIFSFFFFFFFDIFPFSLDFLTTPPHLDSKSLFITS